MTNGVDEGLPESLQRVFPDIVALKSPDLDAHADVPLHKGHGALDLFNHVSLNGIHIQEVHGVSALEPATTKDRLGQELLGVPSKEKNRGHSHAALDQESDLPENLFDGCVGTDVPLALRPRHLQKPPHSGRVNVCDLGTLDRSLIPCKTTAAQVDMGGVLDGQTLIGRP